MFICGAHRRASLGLILTLFLSTLSRGDDGDHHGSPSFHQPEFHSIPLDLRPLQLSNFRSKQDNNRTNNVGEGLKAFTFEYSPGIPNASQGTGDIGDATLTGNWNQSLEEVWRLLETEDFRDDSSALDSNSFAFSPKFLQETFVKGELGWLTRQKRIESLWLDNEGADPKSSLGTAFAFNAPNPQSLWVSNTSILLEYASKAFLKGLEDQVAEVTGNATDHPRRKRQTNSLLDFPSGDPWARVDITPFVPAHEYIANCGVNEELNHCDASQRYRSYSGWCNNLRNPSWGKSVFPFERMLSPVYGDGISSPKQRSVAGRLLPSPRYISSMVHIDVSNLSQRHTLMFMQYAQFVDHDITFTPVNKGPRDAILNCRDCDSTRTVHPECWPISVPASDSYYPAQAATSAGKGYCIPFTRSLAGQQRLGPREQINQNSAYLDSSQIYGENYCKSMSLRSSGGMLNVTFNPSTGGKVLMPQVTQMKECRSPSGYCFYAGDGRASEQPALASVHTIFLREHNRITAELHSINPHWSEEKLYQESRRILTAMNQHVIYSEFLPRLLGPSRIFTYGLQLQNEGYYASYDPHCAANGINEFAAAAFRFGHSLIRPHLARMDQRYSGMSPHIPLRDGFFNSDMLYKTLMVDEIVRGLLAEPMEQMDPFITKEITNHLFEDRKHSFSGMDLIALNLHRGRDHGLQGYNAYRQVCGLARAKNFKDLQSEVPTDVITRLQQVYEHVDDIDLFTGSLVERALPGGILGPTMSCIIGNQFKKLRQCDRFWYETNDPLLQFSPLQLAEIRKATLSKIICSNFDMPSDIQKSAFDAPHNFLNPRLPCNRLPTVNLEAWRETPSTAPTRGCKLGNRVVGNGDAGLSSPCVSCICTPDGPKCASLRITSCARLSQEAQREEILRDSVCTAQCGAWLGLGTGSSAGAGSEYSQHNDLRLQVLQPPPPPPLPLRSPVPKRINAQVQVVNNLFNIINGRNKG